MKARLIIYSNLKKYVKNYHEKEGAEVGFSPGKSVREFIEETIVYPRAMDGISIVQINDQVITFDQLSRKLQDGDTIKIYPPVGGG